tara:strand:- start:572 stop:772 length:201 start_codon:yes stop_codon:yes gene_type:complete
MSTYWDEDWSSNEELKDEFSICMDTCRHLNQIDIRYLVTLLRSEGCADILPKDLMQFHATLDIEGE